MNMAAILGFSEPFSAISHLVAAIVFLLLSSRLIPLATTSPQKLSAVSLYVFSVVFLLAMSGIYHLLAVENGGKALVQRLDHAGIFVLIAGTFTPVHVILFRGFWRWGFLAIIWSLAMSGLTLKTIYFNQTPEWLGLTFYISLGWLGAISGYLTYRRHGVNTIKPLLYGALAYTFGAVMDYSRYPVIVSGVIGPHELFHIAVIAGIAWHWLFIRNLLVSSY